MWFASVKSPSEETEAYMKIIIQILKVSVMLNQTFLLRGWFYFLFDDFSF